MKTINSILTLFAAATLFAGCVSEEPAYQNQPAPVPPGENVGTLSMSGMNMRVLFDTQTEIGNDDTGDETQQPNSTRTDVRTQPDVDQFIVEIVNADNETVVKKTYAEFKAEMTEPMTLDVGNYRMVIRSEEQPPLAAWEHPYYGTVKEFTILKAQTTTIGEVTCTLQNIKVTLMCAVDLAEQLSENTQSTVTLGNQSLSFVKGEKRAAYFMPTAEVNTIDFLLAGNFADSGAEVSFTKKITNVKAGQWRKITLVITYADKGDIKFDIKVDSFVQDDEIVINGTDGLWEALYEPEIDPTAPTIVWPNHELGKPFQLLATMFGADEKYKEMFKMNFTSPNGVEEIVVKISSTNPDFMEALTIGNIPEQFDLCKITPADPSYVMLTALGFPLGDEVKGQKSILFNIANAMPLLYDKPGYKGTHTFDITLTDINGLKANGALILLVDKQNEDLAPTIVWRGYDIEKQYTISDDMTIEIDIEASAGISNLWVTIISDTLTEEELQGVGLPAKFDLAHIDDPELAKKLGDPQPDGLGFPINDKVLNKTQMPFSITSFVPLLKMFEGKHEFKLDVTDNNQKTTTKSVKLFVAN